MIQTRRLPNAIASSGDSSLRKPSSGNAARIAPSQAFVGGLVGRGHRRLVGLGADGDIGVAVEAHDRRAGLARRRARNLELMRKVGAVHARKAITNHGIHRASSIRAL